MHIASASSTNASILQTDFAGNYATFGSAVFMNMGSFDYVPSAVSECL